MFLSDPLAVLRSLSQLVRPGGIVAFHELSWAPFLLLAARLPLWSAGASLVHETFRRSGANTEMGFALYRIFQEAGLPAPTMSLEMPSGMIRNSRVGFPTFLAVCCRKFASLISLLSRSATSLHFQRESKPRLLRQTRLSLGWPSSAPGPANRQTRLLTSPHFSQFFSL